MIGDAVTEEEIWDCTTCRACQEVCPVAVEHVDTILDMRRDLVLMRAKFPAEVKTFFKNMEENGNPWPKPWVSRAYWSEGLGIKKVGQDGDVNTVFWVGCLAAYDERIQRVAIALSRIFKTAGIDFGILGKEERCCGDAVRRMGNEYLFQKLAYHNINFLTKHGVKRIITHCPHGFNTLKNEYPKLGGNFEVIHHTELIADLLNNGDLKPPIKELNQTVVYHDPCYLSRYNDINNYPRRILASVPKLKLVEKAQCMKNTFCCGAGGGRMWMSETGGHRISQVLLEQVMSKKPDVLVTACPFCLTMLDNEVREKGLELSLKVMDIAELFQSVA
jgi:Fe-S oxidoreductase